MDVPLKSRLRNTLVVENSQILSHGTYYAEPRALIRQRRSGDESLSYGDQRRGEYRYGNLIRVRNTILDSQFDSISCRIADRVRTTNVVANREMHCCHFVNRDPSGLVL